MDGGRSVGTSQILLIDEPQDKVGRALGQSTISFGFPRGKPFWCPETFIYLFIDLFII